MPTYEYKCEQCGHTFERFQRITEEPVSVCPVCTAESVKRLISAGAGIVFKGSGFYVTDYRKDAKGSETASPAKETPAKTTSEAPKTSESKPAAAS